MDDQLPCVAEQRRADGSHLAFSRGKARVGDRVGEALFFEDRVMSLFPTGDSPSGEDSGKIICIVFLDSKKKQSK